MRPRAPRRDLIWAAHFEEQIIKPAETTGGTSGAGGDSRKSRFGAVRGSIQGQQIVTRIAYRNYANLILPIVDLPLPLLALAIFGN